MPRPMFPVLGPEGRLLVAAGLCSGFGSVAHVHQLDPIWAAVGLIGFALGLWKSATGDSTTPGPHAAAP